jgi:WXG100 family type VII secretion target
MNDVTEINYEQMEALRGRFLDHAERVRQLRQTVMNCMDALKSGGWISQAATAFYNDMENDLLPAVQRLTDSMVETSETISQIKTAFEAAEEEASALFPAR